MDDDLLVLVIASVVGVAAVMVMSTPPAPRRPRLRVDRSRAMRGLLAGGVGAVVFVLSGWFSPALVAAAVAWVVVATLGERAARPDATATTDALASWIENLRDVLLAGDQPIGAIGATVDSCPATIRPAVRRLAAALGRQRPDEAFRRFADDVDDPLGDLVAAGLSIAVDRGARTSDVLGALATQARQHSDRRRMIEAERAPVEREVTLLTVIMGALIASVFVFGRTEYLSAYDTSEGQLVLGVALAIYAALLVRVTRLSRFPVPARFLTSPEDRARGHAAVPGHERTADRPSGANLAAGRGRA